MFFYSVRQGAMLLSIFAMSALACGQLHAQSDSDAKSKLEAAQLLVGKLNYDGAIEQFRAVQSSVNASELERSAASLGILKCYMGQKKYEEAASTAVAHAQMFSGSYVPVIVAQVVTARLIHAEATAKQGKTDEAIALCRTIVKENPKGVKGYVSSVVVRAQLIELLERQNRHDELLEVYDELFSLGTPLPLANITSFRKWSAGQASDSGRSAKIILTCRKAIASNSLDLRLCELFQQTIAETYLAKQEYDKAISEAKLLVQACGSKEGMEAALNIVMMAFKVKDGNLSRVNQMIQYQKTGKAGIDKELGTKDDLESPLASFQIQYSSTENQLFESAISRAPRDWNGRLARGNLYMFWAKPKEALMELRMGLALAPLEQSAIQALTDRILVVLVEVGKDPSLADRYIQFQRFGPAGVDGKPGTSDDLQNVLDVAMKVN